MRGKSTSQSVRTELKTLRTELRRRSDEAVRRVLKNSDVILSTLTSATDDGPLKILEDMHFDVVVIDECSQVGFKSHTHTCDRLKGHRDMLYALAVQVKNQKHNRDVC